MIGTSNVGGIEMILRLLAKVVTLRVRFAIVEVREPSLQLAFLVTCKFHQTNNLSLKDRVYADLHHQLKVFLGVVGGSRSRN